MLTTGQRLTIDALLVVGVIVVCALLDATVQKRIGADTYSFVIYFIGGYNLRGVMQWLRGTNTKEKA